MGTCCFWNSIILDRKNIPTSDSSTGRCSASNNSYYNISRSSTSSSNICCDERQNTGSSCGRISRCIYNSLSFSFRIMDWIHACWRSFTISVGWYSLIWTNSIFIKKGIFYEKRRICKVIT